MEAHYESALTGELLPESELVEVSVYRMETEGHSHFGMKLAETAYVEESEVPKSVNSVELFMVHGSLASVYREDATYGRAYSPEEDHVDSDKWETVGRKVLEQCDEED